MKICPYCREEIRDEAVKCRYCGSSLIALSPATEADSAGIPKVGPDQVVYVLDQSLVRFAKFAVAILAVFVAVGAALYGFDIRNGVDTVRDGVDKVRESEQSIEKIRADLDAQIAAVGKTAEQVDRQSKSIDDTAQKVGRLRDEAQSLVDSIKQNKQVVDLFVARITTVGHTPAPTDASAIPPQTERPWFTAPELARLYDVPTEFTGKGQTIGLIELGGGFVDADLEAYFAALRLPKPYVEWIGVAGGSNKPGNSELGADGQVALDIEVSGAVAPDARLAVYFAGNSFSSFVDAVKRAAADKVTVLSISWGAAENVWTPQSVSDLNAALKSAAEQGITVLCASGDNGASDGGTDGKRHVDFPASSPWVIAVGGTSLKATGGKIVSEVTWNDGGAATGGGFSDLLAAPDWQSGVTEPQRKDGQKGRGIPDVAANASPKGGYQVFVHGKFETLGGTSGAAPFWAGVVADINQGLGRNIGYFNPLLYKSVGASDGFRRITEGDNSVPGLKGYSAGPGWSAVVGWGSPSVRKLIEAVRASL